jgi:hypothetical protein
MKVPAKKSRFNTRNAKLVLAIALDLFDFTLGRVMGFGTVTDFVFTAIAVAMFGWKGLFQLWETVEISDQFDGFVPTLTLLALWERRENKR